MAVTISESNETRLIFTLRNGDDVKERTIALPGIPTDINEAQTNYMYFRDYILESMPQFVQPSTWRDDTGSTSGETAEPYTTSDVQLEIYEVTKTRYDAN